MRRLRGATLADEVRLLARGKGAHTNKHSRPIKTRWSFLTVIPIQSKMQTKMAAQGLPFFKTE